MRSSTFVSLYSVSSSPFREALDLVPPCARQQLSPCTYYHCAPCFLYPVPPTLYLPPLIFYPRPPAFYLLLSTTYPPPLPLTSYLLPPTSPISISSRTHTHTFVAYSVRSLARSLEHSRARSLPRSLHLACFLCRYYARSIPASLVRIFARAYPVSLTRLETINAKLWRAGSCTPSARRRFPVPCTRLRFEALNTKLGALNLVPRALVDDNYANTKP